MVYVHLFCNPFFDGHVFWKDVQQRLEQTANISCMIHQVEEISDINSWIQQFLLQSTDVTFLNTKDNLKKNAETIHQQNMHTDQHIIVGHGISIPLISTISEKSVAYKDHINLSFVLSNGPLLNMDLVCSTFVKMPRMLQHICISSPLSIPFLASSIAFRRLVVNPYVMDSDMIVRLCSKAFSDRKKTQKCLDYINTCDSFFPLSFSPIFPILGCWGTLDVRYSLTTLTSFEMLYPNMERIDIEGGQHFHPIERPWAISDIIIDWIS